MKFKIKTEKITNWIQWGRERDTEGREIQRGERMKCNNGFSSILHDGGGGCGFSIVNKEKLHIQKLKKMMMMMMVKQTNNEKLPVQVNK